MVLSHIFGVLYGALILSALVVLDGAQRRLRLKVYAAWAAGWLALLVWIPAIRASIAVGSPHGWIEMPGLKELLYSFSFGCVLGWLMPIYTSPRLLGLFAVLYVICAIAYVLPLYFVVKNTVREFLANRRESGAGPNKLQPVVAVILLSEPIVLYLLSHTVTPVLVPRYALPTLLGMAILLTAFLQERASIYHAVAVTLQIIFCAVLLATPIVSALTLKSSVADDVYFDVAALDASVPPEEAVVVPSVLDFSQALKYSHQRSEHYYFLLDWPSALRVTGGSVTQYHLMSNMKQMGYYFSNVQDRDLFMCSHPYFAVLDNVNHSWFRLTLQKNPYYKSKVIRILDPHRSLIEVRRQAPLKECGPQ